jgi:cytochrome bd-type quinol oxidase subunit 2
MTGFGLVRPLPGLLNSVQVNTAITLPIGVEAYGVYALKAWLGAGGQTSDRTRRFAQWSAIGSLLLGMAGQVAYHLLSEARISRAPGDITTGVACLPVLLLGMAAALTHMIRSDAERASMDESSLPGTVTRRLGLPCTDADQTGHFLERRPRYMSSWPTPIRRPSNSSWPEAWQT